MIKYYLLAPCIFFSIAISLISCQGTGSDAKELKNSGPAPNPVEKGKAVYTKVCQACHQPDGKGIPGSFPPLAKSDFITDKNAAIQQVLNGKSGEITVNGIKYNSIMPPQGGVLTNEDIANVLTYVYASFGNNSINVTADEVKAIRNK
jgi:nitrite reductase (NO-forming)